MCLVLALACGYAAAAPVELRVSTTNLSAGQTIELQIVIENAAPRAVPRIEVPGLQIQYVGPSQVMQIINGQAIQQITLNYQLTAPQAGTYVIPPVRVPIGEQWVTTQPIALRVTEMDPAIIQQQAFLRLHLARSNLYAGELALVTVDLYAVAEQQGTPEWTATGFTTGPWQAQRPQMVGFGGRNFVLHRFQTYVLAHQPGRWELGPVRFQARLPAANARRSFFFNEILDWRQVIITNAPVAIEVLPLPPNAPPHFSGLIGAVQMKVSASPTNVAVGDPITVKIELSSEHLLLDTVRLPEQPQWTAFKVYPPTSKLENTGPLGLGGRKIFEQVVVPQSTETRLLPAFQLSVFDPVTARYQTLSGPEFALVVRPSAGLTPFLPAEETNTVGLVAIKPHLGALLAPAPPLLQQPWFLALQLAPLALFTGSWLWRRRQEQLATNPRLRRRRDTQRLITRGLQELQQLAQTQQTGAFYSTLFRLLQERLGERLDLPASAITEAVIDERLRPAGVDAPWLADLSALFQACDQARYAPAAAPADLPAMLAKAMAVLRALEQLELKEPRA
ncbi:MAG: BatD family protein [Verrucomicrobiae bacterium]|nr:BatD family protein [Verrucomicrobiae bacterium]